MHKLLSTAEVAALLRVTPSTVSRMVDRGDIRYQHKSPGTRGAMLFDPDVISAYVAEREESEEKAPAGKPVTA